MSRAYAFGPFRLVAAEQRLMRDGVAVHLPPRAFSLLCALLRRPGELVRKEELLDEVWAGAIVEEGSVTRTISTLRRALGEDPTAPWIETVSRFGYRFRGAVEILEATRPPTVAVLPFLPISGGAEGPDALGVGLADAIVARLGRNALLRLRPTASVLRVVQGSPEVCEAGRALAVDYIVLGHYQEEAGRLKISAQLVRVADEAVLWTVRQSERLVDFYQTQERVADRVAATLLPHLAGDAAPRPARREPATPAALRLFLEGRYHTFRFGPDALREAIRCLREAARLDPGWPLPWAALADAEVVAADLFVPASEVLPEARYALERALALDPEMPEALVARAMLRFWHDWERHAAEEDYRRAVELGPAYCLARHAYGWFLVASGRFDEADQMLAAACELDPLSLALRADRGLPSFFAGRFREAAERFHEAVVFDPDFWYAYYWDGLARLELGDLPAAVACFERARELSAGRLYEPGLALVAVHARAGRRDAAAAELAKVLASAAGAGPLAYDLAIAKLALGERETACALLEQACAQHEKWLGWIAVDPRLDALHDEPRFAAVVAAAGF